MDASRNNQVDVDDAVKNAVDNILTLQDITAEESRDFVDIFGSAMTSCWKICA
jgi:hypothetical protein